MYSWDIHTIFLNLCNIRERVHNPHMHTHHHIDYVEFTAPYLEAVKAFYHQAFGWAFTDYGPDYVAFAGSGIEGGFERGDGNGANPLVILFSEDLDASRSAVLAAGGTLTKDVFPFPGGRRFHFLDPAGNELGVWAE